MSVKRVRYWDLAATDDGCFTAGVRMSVKDNIYYVEHVIRGQWTPYERDQIILQTAQLDENEFGSKTAVRIVIEQEPGSSGVSVIQSLTRLLAGYSIFPDRPTGDKDTRLEPFAAQLEAGNVRLVRGRWNHDFIEELIAIPSGKYRDQADATAGAFNQLIIPATGAKSIAYSGLYKSRDKSRSPFN